MAQTDALLIASILVVLSLRPIMAANSISCVGEFFTGQDLSNSSFTFTTDSVEWDGRQPLWWSIRDLAQNLSAVSSAVFFSSFPDVTYDDRIRSLSFQCDYTSVSQYNL
ncbi:hypothetical protein V8C86DRAFT_2566710, partial [Haematococcus lacustris]